MLNDPKSENDLTELLKCVNWIEILNQLFIEKFNQTFPKHQSNFPKNVFYDKIELRSYLNEPWWLQDTTKLDEPQKKKMKMVDKPAEISQQDFDEIIKRTTECCEKLEKNIQSHRRVAGDTRSVSKDFDMRLYEIEENLRSTKNRLLTELNKWRNFCNKIYIFLDFLFCNKNLFSKFLVFWLIWVWTIVWYWKFAILKKRPKCSLVSSYQTVILLLLTIGYSSIGLPKWEKIQDSSWNFHVCGQCLIL